MAPRARPEAVFRHDVHGSAADGYYRVETRAIGGREMLREHHRIPEHGNDDHAADGAANVGDGFTRDLAGVVHLRVHVTLPHCLAREEIAVRDEHAVPRAEGSGAPVQCREVDADNVRRRECDHERGQPREKHPR